MQFYRLLYGGMCETLKKIVGLYRGRVHMLNAVKTSYFACRTKIYTCIRAVRNLVKEYNNIDGCLFGHLSA